MKLAILILYFAVLIGIGLYCRKHTTDVNGFVLGGRSVGPWLTAFAYGTSYFSAVVFVGYAGQFDRLAVSMGCPRSTHTNNDTALRLGNNATVFWRTF